MKTHYLIIILFFFSSGVLAQNLRRITLFTEARSAESSYLEQSIKDEITALLSPKYKLDFKTMLLETGDYDRQIERVYTMNSADVVVGIGMLACNQLAKRTEFTIPTIAGIIFDNELQQIPITREGTSGISNFTYLKTPFDLQRDFNTLRKIVPFQKLAIIGLPRLINEILDMEAFFSKHIEEEFVYIDAQENVSKTLEMIPEDAEAAYVFPLFGLYDQNQIKLLLDHLAKKNIPVFAFLDLDFLRLGAYAAYESESNLKKIPRLIAISVSKMIEGQQAANLPVETVSYSENLLINMKTVRKIGIFPNWDIMAKATLINMNEVETDRVISLKSAIAETLEHNLDLKITTQETRIVEKEVRLAKSQYGPQVAASTSGVLLDKNTVNNAFGTKGRFNWSAGTSVSQLVLSEPALANIAIQKMLLERQIQNEKQVELDIILDVSQAFLSLLQAREFVKLQNDNVAVTKRNYDIAIAKEKVGYSGISDVYRWQSQLAINNIDLNNAQVQFEQAGFRLNQILNRPISEKFQVEDVEFGDSILFVTDARFFNLIDNPGDIELFANFLVAESFRNLPEIKQIESALSVQRRSLLSLKRSYYTPTVALSGQYDYTLNKIAIPEGIMEAESKPSWNAAIVVQLPIFQGRSRKYQQEQTKLGILQLEDQLLDLRNKLELQVRANLVTAGNSFSKLQLSQDAQEAASKNFTIVQDGYQRGLINITSLIDAQNAALQSEINATNALYQFMADFLYVERSIGFYHFLGSSDAQTSFFQRFMQFQNDQN